MNDESKILNILADLRQPLAPHPHPHPPAKFQTVKLGSNKECQNKSNSLVLATIEGIHQVDVQQVD